MEVASRATLLRRYALPAIALLLIGVLLIGSANAPMFMLFNHLGALTGDTLWADWTVMGDAWVVLVLFLPFIGRRPDLVWAALLASLCTGVGVQVLKHILMMPRPPAVLSPELLHIIGPAHKSGSFPSGHAAAAFVLAGIMALHLRCSWAVAVALLYAVGVAISRMAVGVHWPVDVLAGAALGWLGAVAGTVLAQRWPWGASPRGQRWIAAGLLCAALGLLFQDLEYPQAVWVSRAVAVMALIAAAPGMLRLIRGRETKL